MGIEVWVAFRIAMIRGVGEPVQLVVVAGPPGTAVRWSVPRSRPEDAD